MDKNHAKEYNEASHQKGWDYKRSTQSQHALTGGNSRNARKQGLLGFSPDTFMEYLVRFIVTDDQVSLKLSLLVSYSYMS
jgi:hypothetical protein